MNVSCSSYPAVNDVYLTGRQKDSSYIMLMSVAWISSWGNDPKTGFSRVQ